MEKYDVVVIGGGPAGSTVAKELVEQGKKVLVLEKRKEIGFPNHCSGLVSKEFISFAGIDGSIVLNKIKGASFYSYSNKIISFKDSRTHAVVIDRTAFDRKVAESAMQNGAVYLFNVSVKNIERAGKKLHIHYENRSIRTVEAPLLVIASGARSSVLRLAGFKKVRGETIRTLQVEGTVSLPDEDVAYLYINNEISPNWFAWAIPLGSGRARIGFGSNRGKNLLPLLEVLKKKWALLKGNKINIESSVAWLIPIGFMERPFKENIVVVGDAARAVKPFSGGGLHTGLISAHIASQVLLTALSKKNYSEKMLSNYARLCDIPVRNEIKKGIVLRKIYRSMNDIEKEKFLLSLDNENAKKIILNSGHIDHPWEVGYKLLKYIKSPLFYYLKSHLF